MSEKNTKTGCKIHGPKEVCGHSTMECPIFSYGLAANDETKDVMKETKTTDEIFDKWINEVRKIYTDIEELKEKLLPSPGQDPNLKDLLSLHHTIRDLASAGIRSCHDFYQLSDLNPDQIELIEVFFQEMQRNFLSSKKAIEELSSFPTA